MKYTQIYLLIIRGGGGGEEGLIFPWKYLEGRGRFPCTPAIKAGCPQFGKCPSLCGLGLIQDLKQRFSDPALKVIDIYILKLDSASIVRLGFEAGNTSYI